MEFIGLYILLGLAAIGGFFLYRNGRRAKPATRSARSVSQHRAAASTTAEPVPDHRESEDVHEEQERADYAGFPFDFERILPAPEVGDWCEENPQPNRNLIEEVRRVSGELSVRQDTLFRLMQPCEDPNELTEVINRDPAMAAHVLRTINSPFYGLRSRVGSVFRAVLLLGHIEIRNILLRLCLSEEAGIIAADGEVSLQEHWQHSFGASRVAYALAKSFHVPHADEISTAALLHDVGKLFCLGRWPEDAAPLYGTQRFCAYEDLMEEREWLGVDHAWLSGEIARLWGLPGGSTSLITHHHAPSYTGPTSLQVDEKALAAVHLADLLVHLTEESDAIELAYWPRAGWVSRLTRGEDLRALLTPKVVRALQPAEGWAEAAEKLEDAA